VKRDESITMDAINLRDKHKKLLLQAHKDKIIDRL
jgi:hypothetical protein